MKKIGITGCIGSGKSTVSAIFMQLGIPVYSADIRAKALMNSSPALIKDIKELLGEQAYLTTGKIDRAYIAAQVFNNPDLLGRLNNLVHPAVFADFDTWSLDQPPKPYILKEAALLFETDSYKQVDEVIVVTAPEELRITRTMIRDGLSREAVIARMNNQMSEEDKVKRSQYQIVNDELHMLIPQVLKLHRKFIQ